MPSTQASTEASGDVSRLKTQRESFEPASSRCLEAFTVALNQSWDQEHWYTSTKELQLASLPFLRACRSVTTLWLTIDGGTPPRLLAAADAPLPGPQEGGSTRVPRLRARTVTWKRYSWGWQFYPSADVACSELSRPLYALTDVERLVLPDLRSTDGVVWPRRLRALCLGWVIPRKPSVNWPPSLQQLEFDAEFNQSVEGASWPPSLQHLKFGHLFDRPIAAVSWPPSLQRLQFGAYFNQPIDRVSWPPPLQQLKFGVLFDQPIDCVSWPPSLQQLTFGNKFNQPLKSVSWPSSLQQLNFGDNFNQAVDEVTWPRSLQQLKFGEDFNQAVEGVTWPRSLQQILFGFRFNQPIEGVAWPESLQELEFGSFFNQPIARVKWPASLQDLSFGCLRTFHDEFEYLFSDFDRVIDETVWPTSLRRLRLGCRFRQSLRGLGASMPGLEDLTLMVEDYRMAVGLEWPKTLKRVKIFPHGVERGVTVPPTIQLVVAADIREL